MAPCNQEGQEQPMVVDFKRAPCKTSAYGVKVCKPSSPTVVQVNKKGTKKGSHKFGQEVHCKNMLLQIKKELREQSCVQAIIGSNEKKTRNVLEYHP